MDSSEEQIQTDSGFRLLNTAIEDVDSNRDLFESCASDVVVIPESDEEGEATTPTNEVQAGSSAQGRLTKNILESEPRNKAAVTEQEKPIRGDGKTLAFNATSTPLLSTMRKNPSPCDVTAIEEESDEEWNPDLTASPIKLKGKKKVHMIMSSDDSEEEDKENKIAINRQLFPKKNDVGDARSNIAAQEHEFLDLSQKISNLNLEPDLGTKSFRYQAKELPAEPTAAASAASIQQLSSGVGTIDIGSSDEEYVSPFGDSPEFLDEVAPRVEGRRKDAVPLRSIDQDENEVVEIQTRTVQKNFKEPQSIEDFHSKKLEALQGAAKAKPQSVDVLAYRSNVQKTIQYLADAIQAMPSEDSKAVVAPPPPGLKVELYDHQSYGLEWLHWRESQFPGGGILADEMGLGKTIMMIGLILLGKSEPTSVKAWSCPDSKRSKLVPSKTTLVIVPPSVMAQWESEISNKSPRLRVLVYHGPKRTYSPAVLVQYDVVLSSYNTIGSEISDDERDRKSPLQRVYWTRIILDEGHIIRNCKTNAAKAVYKLEALHRWVVTGTPIHNRPSDMQSLITFLRLKPFDDPIVWDYWIGLKVVKPQNMMKLNTIGKALILRRTKEEVQNVGGRVRNIPPKLVTDVKITMSEDHRKVYDYFKEYAEEQFKLFLKEREAAEKQRAADNYITGRGGQKKELAGNVSFSVILVLMLRMRQVSVLPYLTSTMLENDGEDLTDDFDPLSETDIISLKNPVFTDTYMSAKLEQLFQDLEEIKNNQGDGEMDKVVVVSQWTTLLRIVDGHLRHRGYSVTTISGDIKLADRAEILKRFNREGRRPQIMLLSLAAGGVGLNLVGGNHMIFLDIHYNPQLELQAQDRIHRFGQTKNVYIRRYICEDSMEERVLELQQTKLALSNGLLASSGKKGAAGVGLSLQDIRKLFEM